MSITRYILPVVAGAMAGMMLITAGEVAIGAIYALPMHAGNDSDALARAIAAMPAGAFVLMLVNYAICSFIAGIIATLVAKRALVRPAIVVGVVLTLAGLYNVMHLPHPQWFAIASVLVYLPSAWLGYMAAQKKEVVAGE